MPEPLSLRPSRPRVSPGRGARVAALAFALAAGAVVVAGCGGGSNPLDNPPNVVNPPGGEGRRLSFAYFQRCVFPVLLAELPLLRDGQTGFNTCAGGGCHDDATGTGGALRVLRGASVIDLRDPGLTPELIRATDMYRNYYSAQGVTIPGDAEHSRLLAKPLLRNMLHGGGLIFETEDDPNAMLLRYWIEHPMPASQDEFGPAGNGMFSPPDAQTGRCRIA